MNFHDIWMEILNSVFIQNGFRSQSIEIFLAIMLRSQFVKERFWITPFRIAFTHVI